MRLAAASLAASIALSPGAAAQQLLPAGEFKARDGRPGPGKHWRLDDRSGPALAAAINATAALTPIVVDYDHQTLHAIKTGAKAPAAGWIKAVEWRAGEGLFATIEWTETASRLIAAGEYRYLSAVIEFDDDTGEVTALLLAALVNHPAILGMEAVQAALATRFTPPTPHEEPPAMNLLVSLLATLGLAATTTEAEALSAVAALKTKADAPRPAAPAAIPAALAGELGLAPTADEAAALSAVRALRSSDAPALQAMTALQGQVAALQTQINERDVSGLVEGAIAAHKLLPAQRDWALGLGRKDLAALQAFVAAAPVIPGLGGQSNGRDPGAPATGAAALSATQALIAKQLGIAPEDYAKHLQSQAQA